MVDDLETVLQQLMEKWGTRAHESAAHAAKMRVGNTHHAYYYRGLADGYRAALADLRALFVEVAEDVPVSTKPPDTYAAMTREAVMSALEQAGLAISDLHAHTDSTFSVILSPLQVLSFDDRIAKLTAIGDVAILDYGMMPDSSKAYIDFAFRSPPG